MAGLERILQNTPGSVSQQWYEAGVPVDPGTVTVDVTRADGTLLADDGAVSGTGTGARTFSVSTTYTGLLDRLTLSWVSSDKGTLTSTVEVVGGFLFNLDELTAQVSDATGTYTDAQLADARTYAETQIENACSQAFVPRYAIETFSGLGNTTTVLRWPRVTAIRSVTIDDAAVTPVSSVVALREGLAYYSSGWTAGYGNVVIGYEHGATVLDPGASEAALVLAAHKLIKGPIDDRATQRASEFGPVNLATPGMFGSRFGIPVVDAFVANNNLSVGVA